MFKLRGRGRIDDGLDRRRVVPRRSEPTSKLAGLQLNLNGRVRLSRDRGANLSDPGRDYRVSSRELPAPRG
jgi:hypothetical protein